MELQDPTITWFQWNGDKNVTEPLQETDTSSTSLSKELKGVNRTKVSKFRVGEANDEFSYIAQLVYPDFSNVTLNSSISKLVILDVNMTLASFEGVINSDVQLTCAAYDAVKVQQVDWYTKGGTKYTGSAKRIATYNAKKTRTECVLEWLGVEKIDAGEYYCGVTFKDGYKMTAAESTGIKTATLTILYISKGLPEEGVYITPGFSVNITCDFILPETISTVPKITWSSKSPTATYNETSGARMEGGKYRSVLTTPLAGMLEGTKFAIRVRWLDISTKPTSTQLNDVNSTETIVKLRSVQFAKKFYDSPIEVDNYYAINASTLQITCYAISNEKVTKKLVKWYIKKSEGTDYKNVSYTDGQFVQLGSSFKSPKTTNILSIAPVDLTFDKAVIDCEATFIDGSILSADKDASTITIKVLSVKTEPILYGFQRQNGISKDISAQFTAGEAGELTFEVDWLTCTEKVPTDPKSITLVDGGSFKTTSSQRLVATYLEINVSKANANKYYWPRITFAALKGEGTSKTKLEASTKIYLLIAELCAKTHEAKIMKFPAGFSNSMKGSIYEVGDLIIFYGEYDAAYLDTAGKAQPKTTFYIKCSATKNLMEVVANGLNAQFEITKYSGDCLETKEKVYKIDMIDDGVSKLVFVATEHKFLVWTIKSTQSKKIEIPYTITKAATAKTDAVYSKDYAKITAFQTPEGTSYSFLCLTLCPTERETRLYSGTTGMALTGIPQIQWINNWGVICDLDWDIDDSIVICKTLGNNGGIPIYGIGKKVNNDIITSYNSKMAQQGGLGYIWIDDVQCTGFEPTVYKCKHGGWDQVTTDKKTCETTNYAGVQCLKKGFEGIRIQGEFNWLYMANLSGSLEIKYNDTWGTLCSNYTWHYLTASALCLSLGFGYGYTTLVDLAMANVTHFWKDLTHTNGIKKPLVWLDKLDSNGIKVRKFEDIAEKGPWGRPLTEFAECGINKTIHLHCAPRLQCFRCKSTNVSGCYNQSNMKIVTCSEDVLRCYKFKRIQADGTTLVEHDCMADTMTTKETCKDLKKRCTRDTDETCFCRDCFGRICNASPMYRAAAAMTNTVTGSMSGIMYMINAISKLIRIGMFDTSLFSTTTNTTNATNATGT